MPYLRTIKKTDITIKNNSRYEIERDAVAKLISDCAESVDMKSQLAMMRSGTFYTAFRCLTLLTVS